MKIKEGWNVVGENTAKASGITFCLGLVLLILGIVMKDVFDVKSGSLLILFNILQYSVHGAFWQIFVRNKEVNSGLKNFIIPVFINYAGYLLYYTKIIIACIILFLLLGGK